MTGTPNRTLAEVLRGNIDFASDTFRVALFDNSTAYTFDPDNHEFVSDVLDGGTTAQEPTDASYSRQQLANQTTTPDNTNDDAEFDADDVTFSSLSTSNDIQGIIVFKQVTDDTDSPILFVIDDADDADLPATTNGSDFTIEWSSNGALQATEP